MRVWPTTGAERPRHLEHVERRPVPPVERILDRRLEAVADVEDEGSLLQAPDVARGQLEIVRLGPGRREIVDAHAASGHLLGRVRERVERRDDRRP